MKKYFFYFALTAILLSSCNKDEFDKILVQIEGLVTNGKTGDIIEGAEVVIITNGGEKKSTTDETGYFNFGEMTAGDYVLIVKKEGFLSASQQIYASSSIRLSGNSKEIANYDLSIVPMTDKLVLTVYRQNGNNTGVAAANVPYTIYLGKFNTPITGNTDNNGLIELDNMPGTSTSNMYIDFDFEVGGVNYKNQINYYNAMNNDYVIVYSYSVEGDFGLVATNLLTEEGEMVEDFAIDQSISFTLTQPIDLENFDENDNINVYPNFSYTTVWSTDGRTLTIYPSSNLYTNTDYSINIQVVNEAQTQSFGINQMFKTEE